VLIIRKDGKMTRKNVIFLTLLMLLFFLRVALAAAVTVEIGKGTVPAGETIELPITVSNIKGLGIIAVDLSLGYDTSVLSFSSLTTRGTILEGSTPPVYNNTPGILNIAIYNTKPFKGKGKFLKVSFDVNKKAKPGKTKVVLRKVVFNDGKIGARLKNGMIKITPLR
jgi:hypothetical protein